MSTNTISTPDTLEKEVSTKPKKTITQKNNDAIHLAEQLIPKKEFSVKSTQEVKEQPHFYHKIKEVEEQLGKKFYEFDFDIQEAIVLRRLQQMTNNLFLNPFWNNRLKESGITEAPKSFEEWQNIPLTDKETMVAAFNGKREGMIIPFSEGGFEIVASGGTSSGIPLETVYELDELQETYEMAGEFMGKFITDKYLSKEGPKWMATTLADYQMWSSGTMVGGVLQKIPKVNFLGAGPLNTKVFQHMMSYKGEKAIMSTSNAIALLADFGRGMDEERRNSFKIAMYGSGLMSNKQEEALREVYPQVEILSYFAATQAETIGLQLDHANQALSTVPGLHFVEIVDENGKWVKEGEEGELVITRLHTNKVPNIRYKLGDRVVRLKRMDTPELKTEQFLFKGRSGDVIHLGDSHFSAPKAEKKLFSTLEKEGIPLTEQAIEIQFSNDRKSRKLTLLVSALNANEIQKKIVDLGEETINNLFVESLIQSLPLFNTWEANRGYIEKSKYQFFVNVVEKGSKEIFRTTHGKTPLIRDRF